jgi:hypothetical protein
MIDHESDADRLFPTPVTLIHAHFTWTARTGWSLQLSHRHEGELLEMGCIPDSYERLTFAEAASVLVEGVGSLLPWLSGDA